MAGHRKWSEIRAEAIASGRLTEEGIAAARADLEKRISEWQETSEAVDADDFANFEGEWFSPDWITGP